MTVVSELCAVTRTWTGVETLFETGFVALAATHCRVTAGSTVLTRGTHYTSQISVAGTLQILPLPGMLTAPQTLLIERVTPATQLTNLVNGDTWDMEAFEKELDASAMRDAEARRLSELARTDAAAAFELADGFASIQIPNNSVTNARLADMADGTIKMRLPGAGAGDPVDATIGQLRDVLADLFVARAPSRTALKALDTTKVKLAYLTQGKRQGMFAWTEGDFTTRITLDTTEAFFIKADGVDASLGAWVRVSDHVSPEMAGALVNGSSNDYPASLAAFQLAVRERLAWLCPGQDYTWDLGGGSAIWDPTFFSAGGRRAIKMAGVHTHQTTITITNASSIGWQVCSFVDWFDCRIEGMTVKGAFDFPLFVLGRNDYSDPVNMPRLTDFSVENSFNGPNNVACRLNYIAFGQASNFRCASYALAVDNILVAVNGTALQMRQCHGLAFAGGGYGNGDIAIDLKDGFNTGNTWQSSTLENSRIGISHRSNSSGANTWTSVQLTNCFEWEVQAPGSLPERYVLLINCNYDGSLDVDPANCQGVRIIDRATIVTPSPVASNVPFTNNTGRDVIVEYWGLTTLTSITRNGFARGRTTTSGEFFFPAGQTGAMNFTGPLTWIWTNAG